MIGAGVLSRILPGLGGVDLVSLVPAEVVGAARACLDAARASEALAPVPPSWLDALLGAEERRSGMPAALLAALAAVLSGYRPEGRGDGRAHGLCGVPWSVADGLPGPAGPLAATTAQLSTGDPAAWDALRGNVRAAAAEIERLRDECGGSLVAAVAAYCRAAVPDDAERTAWAVLGAWLLLAARDVPADVLAGVEDVIGG